MSTTKTVNVTTGKVLHYTIKKAGYKSVSGSKLITGPETINVNMVPESSSDGVYVFGDRIGGCATFFGYFDSVDPNTQAAQKYACFVLDAQYRKRQSNWVPTSTNTILPNYGDASAALAAKESATYNTQTVIDNNNPSSGQFYDARNPGGQSLIIDVGGVNYVPQVPNIKEIQMVQGLAAQLDALDPTVSSYSNLALVNILGTGNDGGVYSSNESDANYCIVKDYEGYRRFYKNQNYRCMPIFEIPVN